MNESFLAFLVVIGQASLMRPKLDLGEKVPAFSARCRFSDDGLEFGMADGDGNRAGCKMSAN